MNLQAFWHVAILGSWRDVLPQQVALFAQVGLRPTIGVVGPTLPRSLVLEQMGDVAFRHPNVAEYETPTLQILWEWCKGHPGDAVLYCHTKGVSHPGPIHTAWRKLMEYHVVERWRENLPLLEDHDAVGVNWRTSAPGWPPHFTGTFWMARADWINKLPSPWEHRHHGDVPQPPPGRRASWQRMHAEMWIGAAPDIRVVSLACRDTVLPRLPVLQALLKGVGRGLR